jgi:hypothetical protein
LRAGKPVELRFLVVEVHRMAIGRRLLDMSAA